MFVVDQKQALDSIEALERRLHSAMRPVSPDPAFVNHLHRRLNNEDVIYDNSRPISEAILIIAAGLFTGVLLAWLLRKR
jgi:hypothetical protein